MAIALARKYRPKRFSDLLVQDHVANVLRGAIARHRVGHGYLLTGPRGVGKDGSRDVPLATAPTHPVEPSILRSLWRIHAIVGRSNSKPP